MKWESLGNNPEKPHMMDLVRPGLKWAYKYYARMDYTPTYIIVMHKPIHPQSRFQISNDHIQSSTPSIRMSWILHHWDENYITTAETQIQEIVSLFTLTMP